MFCKVVEAWGWRRTCATIALAACGQICVIIALTHSTRSKSGNVTQAGSSRCLVACNLTQTQRMTIFINSRS
jgi:hypothetical protein